MQRIVPTSSLGVGIKSEHYGKSLREAKVRSKCLREPCSFACPFTCSPPALPAAPHPEQATRINDRELIGLLSDTCHYYPVLQVVLRLLRQKAVISHAVS